MHLLNTLVAVIVSVVISNALTIDVSVAIKDFKESKEAITHEPITVQPAGGTSKHTPIISMRYKPETRDPRCDNPRLKRAIVVKGAKDCGSEATAVEMQFAGCEDLPCGFQAGTNIDLEIGFKAAEDFAFLAINITRIGDSQEDVLVEET